MRILFFSEQLGVHESRFLRGLATSGQEVAFLAARGEVGDLPPGVQNMGSLLVDPRRAGDSDVDAGAVKALRDLELGFRPDVVHAGPLSSCAYWAALAGGAPLLAMSWSWDLMGPEATARLLERSRLALRCAAAACCDSQTAKGHILRASPNLEGKVFVFPWGVELDRFTPDVDPAPLRARAGWQDAIIVLSTRSMEPLYGFSTLVKAAVDAARTARVLRIAIAGQGSLMNWAVETTHSARLGSKFAFLGVVAEDEVPALFAACDIYLSCSLVDGTSVSLLEAMAMGRPVIVSDLPANHEWVREGENGWLVPVNDSMAVAERLVAFNRLPREHRLKMGVANRLLACRAADWKRSLEILLQAYRSVPKHAAVLRISAC